MFYRFTEDDCPGLDAEARIRENSRGPLEIDLGSNTSFDLSQRPSSNVSKKPGKNGIGNGDKKEPPKTNKLSSKGTKGNDRNCGPLVNPFNNLITSSLPFILLLWGNVDTHLTSTIFYILAPVGSH